MNCKPGDLVVVVRVSADALRGALGLTFTVTEPIVMSSTGHPGWKTDKRQTITMLKDCVDTKGLYFKKGEQAFFDEVPDWWLQPIRGPRLRAGKTRDTSLEPKRQVEHSR